MRNKLIAGVLLFLAFSSFTNPVPIRTEVQNFLNEYNRKYKALYTASSDAQWKSNISIVEGDTLNAWLVAKTDAEFAAYTGSREIIEKTRGYLKRSSELGELQVKQLQAILYIAANNPETVSALVAERTRAGTEQSDKLYGYKYILDGKEINTNAIDDALKNEKDLTKRKKVWELSKNVGVELKGGLEKLRRLRNDVVRDLGYPDFFSYQVSEYGMTTDEMMKLMKKLNEELRPLYRELHTYARYELAKKYGVTDVPDMLPAHWLPNRWGQDWSPMITVDGLNIDSTLKTKTPEWIVKEGERFYMSLGFEKLPDVFWKNSNLYPYPEDSKVKKNNHASAWHMDLEKDVRSLMSIEPNSEWFETSNHELGHIYYYLTYSTIHNPPLLRQGANRAYHEAMGSLMGLAAMQKPFLVKRGLVDSSAKVDEMKVLLKEALNFVVFIPFSAGTMTAFEKELYADNLPADRWNKRWWELAEQYQGIKPPENRNEMYCDAATKTHINDDAAQYYDYALSYVILFQLHNHICKNILKQQPRSSNYWGSVKTGEFLKKIMSPGSGTDWRKLLKETTGEELNAKAILEYFEPLIKYLKKENEGRKYTLPEKIEE